jgi:subtilisin family serine protease
MTRTVVAAIVSFCFVATTFAGSSRTYIVGVKPLRSRVGVASRVLTVDADGAVLANRDFTDFKNLDAFSADLTDDEAAALRQQPDVTFVEQSMPVYAYETAAPRAPFKASAEFRDASVQTMPWGISAVHASSTWTATRGDNVNVAIIDTGIDYNHPDLKDDYAGGYNFVAKPNTSDPLDDNGHGTHVAGIIGAEDNTFGVVGVAPHTRLWSVKVLGSDGSGSTLTIAAGIDWVISKKTAGGGNWIINMSLGICSDPTDSSCATAPPQAMLTACQKAADAGILIFAASGNDSAPGAPKPVGYPAAFSTVMAVGAVDSSSAIASFSNQGPELAVVAPGVGVLSTLPVGTGTNTYAKKASTLYNADALTGSKKDTISSPFVYCGIGASASDFPAGVKGKIALIQRGTVTFNQKTKNAVSAGATGVIIYNCSKTASPATCGNDDFSSGWTLIGKVDSTGNPNTGCSDPTSPVYNSCKDDPADLAYPWPVTIRLNNTDGETFHSDSSATVTAVNAADDYGTLSGTSMATPHAVGVAALVWSAAPNATATDVRQAIINTAHDLGAPGQDTVYGFGLVDAYAAAMSIAPQLFGSTTQHPPTQTPTGRRILKRGR